MTMKSAAIGATLLLHMATIGAIIHLAADQGAARPQVAAIALLRNDEVRPASLSVPERENGRSRAAPFAEPSAKAPIVHGLPTAAAVNDRRAPAEPSGPGGASESAVKKGVTIPASYAAGNRKPAYPYLSRRQGEQGTVQLRVLVTPDGRAGEVQVSRSSGYPLLDESAFAAVRDWRFYPASVNGVPVAEWYQIAIPFKLPN